MMRLRVFGAGVRGALVADLIDGELGGDYSIEGFYDDRFEIGALGPGGYPILGGITSGLCMTPGSGAGAFVAMGTKVSAFACRVFHELREKKVPVPNLVSRRASVAASATLGLNALIFPGVCVGSFVSVGHLFCAHGNSVVEHHSRLGHDVLLGPGVSIAGHVGIGSHCFLGAGASVKPECALGAGVLIGTGAVVVKSIPAYTVAYGHPARPQRGTGQTDELPDQGECESLARLGL